MQPNNLSHETDRLLSDSKRLLADNQTGGRHRLAGKNSSIGKASAEAKLKQLVQRGMLLGVAIVAILMTMTVAGFVLNGIGFWGVVMTAMALAAAVAVFGLWPAPKPPKRAELGQGDPKQMVARLELWLEAQRDALPDEAASILDTMGVQLDALGVQLETLDPAHSAMGEMRELVGEYIPETIENYLKIPAHLRKEEHAGGTADERLTTSLTKLSAEIDRVTRRLAEGALDDLAVKSRYLDYRYGGDELLEDLGGMPDTGVPLPDLSATPAKQGR